LKDIDYKEAVRKQMMVNEHSKPYNVEDALKDVKTEKKNDHYDVDVEESSEIIIGEMEFIEEVMELLTDE
jgi:hypothetical protein